MLNNDAAVFAEMFGRISRQNSNVVQSVGAGRERADGFKAKCLEVFVVFFDVRRVGDDEIEFLVGKGANQLLSTNVTLAPNASALPLATIRASLLLSQAQT